MGPPGVEAWMTFSSFSGCSRKGEGMGGKLGTGLFLESLSLCTSQAPLTSVPSSVLENDFKPRSVKQLGRKRMVMDSVEERSSFQV